MLVQSTPIPLVLNQKVDYAQRYWSARHPEHDALEQVLNPSTGMPPRNEGTPMSQAIQPATVHWQKKDPLMEELERKMSEMTVYIADLRRDLPRGLPRRQQTYTIQQ